MTPPASLGGCRIGEQRQTAELRGEGDAAIRVVTGRFEPLLASGLLTCLRASPGVQVVASDLGSEELAREVSVRSPHVAVMNQASAHVLLRPLQVKQPTAGVLVLATRPTLQYGLILLTLGASCISEGATLADIVEATRLTAEGRRSFLDPAGERFDREADSQRLLTKRELDVLSHVSERRTDSEIGSALGIEVETVRKHTMRLRYKLGVQRRKDLVGLPVPTDVPAEELT